MPSTAALKMEFNGYLKTVHAGISDRIGQGILHQEYDEAHELPDIDFFQAQSEPVFEAYRALSRYDNENRLHQPPKLILLPPSTLLDTQLEQTEIETPADRFLNRFSGTAVFSGTTTGDNPTRLVQGVSEQWELAVTQGDWSESLEHRDFDPDKKYTLPSDVEGMTHLSPLGYVALGGDVDREEKHCTYLLTNEGTPAYGSYRHASTDTNGEFTLAQVIISATQPPKHPKHPKPLPLRQRLTFRAGQAT